MPRPPIPAEIEKFLRQPHPAVIASLRPDGSPHSAATWYAWEDGRALVNMDQSRVRLSYVRDDPRVSLTVIDRDDWYRQVTLSGRVVSLVDDTDLADIDRLATSYTGGPYRVRDRLRVSAWIEPDRWYAWDATAASPPPGS
jgi:PPOX class probable F420-dependent enzyme